ncbi:PIG-L deacetylase family protein [Dyadobacter sediminis]|uniref:PIG-L family deacetylase n=1 Tax=Dyadobacter sediminis TaxID=1493691 RepID=A0A5R9KBB7_9BACT|nr:PIG-L deacetylase family protein [Dyadobacter sediminis]TLU92064.1 PIG-L family deacetylase [Dyadobacter sediminis]GGB97732.1 hypothetical protein GCM10011325_26330 [Dyadobacter sediminis]
MGLMQKPEWYENASRLSVEQLGRTLIVAPHQDDESLGCGGIIYLLTQLGTPVHVVFVSDGSMSHPDSEKYPLAKRISLREEESRKALEILGVPAEHITFLRLKDSQVPAMQMPGFDAAADLIRGVISRFEPQTLFVPWRRDPHPDHRATWQIVDHAWTLQQQTVRKLEYFIWLWERADSGDLPLPAECRVWTVDIKTAVARKRQAIKAHVSQTTRLIDDDPQGFMLSEAVLSHFDKPFEVFIETYSNNRYVRS